MFIRVSNTINLDDLFTDAHGIDKRQSGANLIQQTSAAWREYLGEAFPNAQIELRMRLNEAERVSPNIVFVEFGESIAFDLYNEVRAQLNEIALDIFVRSDWTRAA